MDGTGFLFAQQSDFFSFSLQSIHILWHLQALAEFKLEMAGICRECINGTGWIKWTLPTVRKSERVKKRVRGRGSLSILGLRLIMGKLNFLVGWT